MKYALLAAAAALFTLSPFAAQAQPSGYLEAGVGANLGETQPDAFRVGGGVTYDNLRGSVTVDRLDLGAGHALDVGATAALDLAPQGLINPYVEGGYGKTFDGTNGIDSEGDGAHYGAGVSLQPACNIAFDANVRRRERGGALEPDDTLMVGVRVGGNRRCGQVTYSAN